MYAIRSRYPHGETACGDKNHVDGDTASEQRHIVSAREAVLAGMSREQVIEATIKRIRRDEGYLACRKASGRRTSYDELVYADLRALAPAACWLLEQQPVDKRSDTSAQMDQGGENDARETSMHETSVTGAWHH